jgi:hypothetical protein
MRDLSLILTYFENPLLFLRQVEEWENYPSEIQDRLKVYITDDCSPNNPITEVLRFPERIEGHAYRIKEKVAWNWIAGRNIAAHNADTKWLLITDLDHIVIKDNMIKILDGLDTMNPSSVFWFSRERRDGIPMKDHSNSYLMTREMYWRIGGHDEYMSGLYFGTTAEYRRRLFAAVSSRPKLDIPLTYFDTYDNVVHFERDFYSDKLKLAHVLKQKRKEGNKVKTMSFSYTVLQ